MKKNSILTALVMLNICGFSQVIRPGDAHLKLDRIKPSHDFYRNIISDPSGKLLYDFMMENSLTIDSVKKQIIFARYRQIPAGEFSTDTSVTELSLNPIRMHEIHYQRKVDIVMTFQPDHVIVTRTRNGVPVTKDSPMEKGYFEDNMVEYLFGYLQLEKAVTYTLDNFNPATNGNDPYILKYAFDDTWNFAGAATINCDVLEFIHGDTKGHIWIDKVTHQILKTIGENAKMRYVLTRQ